MSFFKKVAGAFVQIEPSPGGAAQEATALGGEPATQGSPFDSITRDAAQLLTQLDGGSGAASTAAGDGSGSTLTMTADDVFRAAGFEDGPHSAPRLLKIVAGLTMFPVGQQLAMVRAMDAADDGWSEVDVLRDATRRVGALGSHLQRVAAERDARIQTLTAEIHRAREAGTAVLAEIDSRIAELQKRRERESGETAAAVASLEKDQARILEEEQKARQAISQVSSALQGLVAFFGGGAPPAGR